MSNPYGYPNGPPGSGYPPMMPQHNYPPNTTPYTTYQGGLQPQHPPNPVYTNYGQPAAQPMYHQPQPQMQHHPSPQGQPQPPPLSFHPQQANNFHNVTALASPPPSLQQRPPASAATAQQPPNLPPGISINRPKLPPGIQVQRTNSPPAPRPNQPQVTKTVPNLPSGIQIQREPQKSVPKLPPGISISQGSPSSIVENKLPKSVSISRNSGTSENSAGMNRLSKLAGISISGGSSGPSPSGGGVTITKNTNGTSEPSSNPLSRLSHLNVSISGGSNGSPTPVTAPALTPVAKPAASVAPRAVPSQPRPNPSAPPPMNTNQLNAMASNNSQPKTYRPLVKDFEQDGFDLSKVKMEKGLSQAEQQATHAPSSYFQRRLEPLRKSTISITPASKESSESEDEEDEPPPPPPKEPPKETSNEKVSEEPSEDPSDKPSESKTSEEPSDEASKETANDEKDEEPKENDDQETATEDKSNDMEESNDKEDSAEPMEQDDQDPKEAVKTNESPSTLQLSAESDEHQETTEEMAEEETEEEASTDNHEPVTDENSMDVQASPQESPFKRPSDTVSIDENSMTSNLSRPGRDRHLSTASEGPEGSEEADTDSNAEQRQRSDLDAQYEVQLAFYNKKHVVGQDTVCMFCLTRCASKEPKIMTCLHSACSACFKQSLEEAQARNDKQKPDVVTVEMDEDGCPIEQEIMVTCPLCKETSSERDIVDNLFLTSNDNANEDDDIPQTHMCESCDESNVATMTCADCECNLCDECVQAHKKLKKLKDHQLSALEIADANSSAGNLGKSLTAAIGTPHDLKCKIHNSKLELYCEQCEVLTCKDCQLSEKHKMHKYRPTHEVVQDVKAGLGQAISDIKLKKNTLDENRALLDTEVTKINIKEKSLMTQLQELKSYFMAKIEARFKELTKDVTEKVRVKRKAICGRKTTLDKFYSQAEYALNFIDYAIQFSDADDKALLVAKRSIERRVRRLKKLDSSTGLQGDAGVKLDLYFQHYASQQMHSSLESVIKQVMGDIQILSAPPPVPAPAPMPMPNYQVQQPQQLNNVINRPSPVQRMPIGSPTPKAAPIRRTPVTTPTKSTTPTKPRGSPMRGGMTAASSRGRGAVMPTGRGGRGSTVMPRGGRVMTSARGGPSMVSRGGAMRGVTATRGRGSVSMTGPGVRGGGVVKRGASPAGRGVARGATMMRGAATMMRGAATMMRGATRPTLPTKAGSAVSITTIRTDNKPPPLMRGGTGQQQQMGMMQQGANGGAYASNPYYMAAYGGGGAPAPTAPRTNQYGGQYGNQYSSQIRPQMATPDTHITNNWHTPQGVTLSTMNPSGASSMSSSGMADNSFKITLPSKNVRAATMMPQHQMVSSSPGIMSYDKDGAPIFSNPSYHNHQQQPQVQNMTQNSHSIPSVPKGISITPSSASQSLQSTPSNANQQHQAPPAPTKKDQDGAPDLSALLDDDDWMSQAVSTTNASSPPPSAESDPLNIDPLASTSTNDQAPMVSIEKGSSILETELDLGTITDPNPVKTELKKETEKSKDDENEESAPEMQGNDNEDNNDEEAEGDENDWCAVCHDGGDTLYCCDRCPKVYHLFCYIPPLTEEPPDDWVCDMCRTQDEIFSFSTGKKIPKNQLSESDQKMCTRILFELYNKYPESVMFRDCSDLNFKEYLDVIKEPIALDVIKEKLDRENPEMYASVPEFLSDIRKMFRNCLKFHERGSDFYTHGKTLEEFLDKFLEQWLPDYAYETFEGSNFSSAIVNPEPSTSTGKKRKKHKNSTDDEEIVKKKKKAKKGKKSKKAKRSRRSNESSFINDNDGDSDSQDLSDANLSDISNTEQLDRLDDLEAQLSRKKKKARCSEDEEDEEMAEPQKPAKRGGKKSGRGRKKKK